MASRNGQYADRCRPDGGRVVVIVTLLALGGCSATGSLFGRSESAPPRAAATASPTTAEPTTPDSGGLADYLTMLTRLADGDALTRAETFSDAEDDAAYAPTTKNRLRYALALAVPGHPGSDPEAGAARLRDLIAASETLTPAERMLATVQLQNAEQLVRLQGSRVELEQRLDQAVATRDAETAERIRSLQGENERLRKELEDATSMLDAITSIEESISEREDDAN